MRSVGQPGRLAVAFAREAKSPTYAPASASKDMRRAVPTARRFEAAPDVVVFDVARSAKQINRMKAARDREPKVTRHFDNRVA
jgi:hypothetical protein